MGFRAAFRRPVPDRYRTIWSSGLPLGTRTAKKDGLLHVLDRHEADRYYRVGDLIDGWALQQSWT